MKRRPPSPAYHALFDFDDAYTMAEWDHGTARPWAEMGPSVVALLDWVAAQDEVLVDSLMFFRVSRGGKQFTRGLRRRKPDALLVDVPDDARTLGWTCFAGEAKVGIGVDIRFAPGMSISITVTPPYVPAEPLDAPEPSAAELWDGTDRFVTDAAGVVAGLPLDWSRFRRGGVDRGVASRVSLEKRNQLWFPEERRLEYTAFVRIPSEMYLPPRVVGLLDLEALAAAIGDQGSITRLPTGITHIDVGPLAMLDPEEQPATFRDAVRPLLEQGVPAP